MNSLLQALARCATFRESISNSKDLLSTNLHAIFKSMDQPDISCVDASLMTQLTQDLDSDPSEQDVHEWFICKFAGLPAAHCFKGKQTSTVTCGRCNTERPDPQEFVCLELALDGKTVQEMLCNHQKSEKLQSMNRYQCDFCEGETDASKQLSIQVDEQSILVILLKRWSSGKKTKRSSGIKAKKSLQQIDPFEKEIEVDGKKFEAVAVCCHVTKDFSDHYKTFVKTKSGIVCCDDENISFPVTYGWKKGSYMCFYVPLNTST